MRSIAPLVGLSGCAGLCWGQDGEGGKEERSFARIPPPVNGLVVVQLVVTTRHATHKKLVLHRLFVERIFET